MLKRFFEKTKNFIKEKPIIASVIGGGLLFLFWFLFLRRGVNAGGAGAISAPLQVIPPGERFIPPDDIGTEPQWLSEWQATQRNILGELENIGEGLTRENRNVAFIQEVIRDTQENIVHYTPDIPEVVHYTPDIPEVVIPEWQVQPQVARQNIELIDRLHADIRRVEAARGTAAESWFARQYGSIGQYLASQRERLRQAVGG